MGCRKEFLGKREKIDSLKVFRAELIIIGQTKLKGPPLTNWLQIWHLLLRDSAFPISFTSSYSWILHYDTFLSCYGMDTPKSDTTYFSHILGPLSRHWASSVAQLVKNPPAVWKTWVPSLGWERLPTPVFWPGEFHGLYSPWGCKTESDTTELLSLHFTSLSRG